MSQAGDPGEYLGRWWDNATLKTVLACDTSETETSISPAETSTLSQRKNLFAGHLSCYFTLTWDVLSFIYAFIESLKPRG